ncbi:MAG TPA: 4-hydroxythreonine-4-phosphate dehydrogenase PdxA [Burkholderiales bacterium]|nr:4-hydroxythreonine-4-phosphate dehydrogenase PdxA [Burkholderiales bacterium]
MNTRASGATGDGSKPVIALTPGEPAGIGPDLAVMLSGKPLPARIVVIADRTLLADRARALRVSAPFIDYTPGELIADDSLRVLHVPLAAPAHAGTLDPRNAPYVLRTLELAADGCRDGTFDAMVTAPVHKGVINDAGIPFTGHTEFLAERTRTAQVVMMLAGGGMRVALATTHLALKDVAGALTQEGIERGLRIVHDELKTRFGIARPCIAVAGLNPHAGESGHLGREEIEIIIPVLERLRAEGYDVPGPFPADTLFQPQRLRGYDAVYAMYHDQGLPVLKYASFGSGINITLGLPIIRTSVDHGTALDLAGTGRIDDGSLLAAIELAAELARNRRRAAH